MAITCSVLLMLYVVQGRQSNKDEELCERSMVPLLHNKKSLLEAINLWLSNSLRLAEENFSLKYLNAGSINMITATYTTHLASVILKSVLQNINV